MSIKASTGFSKQGGLPQTHLREMTEAERLAYMALPLGRKFNWQRKRKRRPKCKGTP